MLFTLLTSIYTKLYTKHLVPINYYSRPRVVIHWFLPWYKIIWWTHSAVSLGSFALRRHMQLVR